MGFELIKCGLGTGLIALFLRWLVPVPTIDPSVVAHFWSMFVLALQLSMLFVGPTLLLASALMLVTGIVAWATTALLATYRRKAAV